MYPQSSFKEAHFFWELSVSENYAGISEWTESYRGREGEKETPNVRGELMLSVPGKEGTDAPDGMLGIEEMLAVLRRKLSAVMLGRARRREILDLQIYICEHFDEKLTRSSLAAMVFLSENHLSRIFRRETGMSIPEFVRKVRLQQAMYMLRDSDKTIQEIASQTGFLNHLFQRNFQEGIRKSTVIFQKLKNPYPRNVCFQKYCLYRFSGTGFFFGRRSDIIGGKGAGRWMHFMKNSEI